MSNVRVSISISVDGYASGPDQRPEEPLGTGGEHLHDWVVALRAWREAHGREGGEENASSPIARGMAENVGATVMGRNMFGGGPGPWGDDPWKGWWGDEPPFHHPVFVVTHHDREPLELADTTFHFVTDGIESALEQARQAAGSEDVAVAGGATTVNEYLRAGLLDEILISVAPILLGGGSRLFDDLGDARPELEPIEVVDAPGVTHIRYRVG
jgi:dihydrofolate reductase